MLVCKFPIERYSVGRLALNDDIQEIAETIEKEVGFPAILKPTEGSRGRSVLMIKDKVDFIRQCKDYRDLNDMLRVPYALYQNLNNPIGLFAEEYLPHAFDLRILMSIAKNEAQCLGCLARVGRDELEVAKNTALGSIPLGVEPPEQFREIALESAKAVVSSLRTYDWGHQSCSILGVDIIPASGDPESREEIYSHARALSEFKDRDIEESKQWIENVLRILIRRHGKDLDKILSEEIFQRALEKLDESFARFRELDAYAYLQDLIRNHLKKCRPYVTEINTRVDFEYSTRNLACPGFSDHISKCAVELATGSA